MRDAQQQPRLLQTSEHHVRAVANAVTRGGEGLGAKCETQDRAGARVQSRCDGQYNGNVLVHTQKGVGCPERCSAVVRCLGRTLQFKAGWATGAGVRAGTGALQPPGRAAVPSAAGHGRRRSTRNAQARPCCACSAPCGGAGNRCHRSSSSAACRAGALAAEAQRCLQQLRRGTQQAATEQHAQLVVLGQGPTK